MNQRLSLGMANPQLYRGRNHQPEQIMVKALRVAALLAFAFACRSSTPAQHANEAPPAGPGVLKTNPEAQVVDTPPADVSHGEARIGGPNASPAPVEARLPPIELGRLRRIRFEVSHRTIDIAPGVKYAAWTFDGRIPGPAYTFARGTRWRLPWSTAQTCRTVWTFMRRRSRRANTT
jgi:hypothetical protein